MSNLDNPRDYANATFYTWHSRYTSPDEHSYKHLDDFIEEILYTDFEPNELMDAIKSSIFENLMLKPTENDGEYNLFWKPSYREHFLNVDAYYENCTLTDEDGHDSSVLEAIREQPETIKLLRRKYYIKPVYMLDHSAHYYSTTPFIDKWDSGLVGIVFISHEDATKLFGNVKDLDEKAEKLLDDEVAEYSAWINDEC